MLSCLVPPRFGQEDQITMPSSTAFSLQFPSLASSLHHAAEKQHFENASNYHQNTSPSPPISTKSPIGGTVTTVDQHLSNAQQQQHYHPYITQQQQQQHQEQQRQHHHAMAMAIANMAANGAVGPKSPSTLNGYDEGGRSTSSPGSSTTMGDLCSAHIGPMTGPGGPHACAQCSTAFPTREMLEKHEMMHSPNTTVCCKVCHKTFANVYRLQRHMISHDESALLRKFKCTECDKAFKFKHHLKEHVRIHSGEKPFACDNCGKRFSHSGSYSSHMTSKKCISMGLKLNNNRSMMKSLEKVAPLGLGMAGSPNNSKRPGGGGLSQNPMSYFPPGLPNLAGLNTSPVTNSNNNAFYPMLPKYSNYDAMNAALLASLQNPFYSMGLNPRIHPYSITRLLELTAAGNNRLQADPEDMIEEVTEDVVDDQKLVMDLEEQDESKTDRSGRNSPMNGKYERSSPDQQNSSSHEHQSSKDDGQDRSIDHDEDDDDEDDCDESSPSPDRDSPEIKVEECADEETLQCARCAKKFNHRTELVQHEKVLCGMFNTAEQQQHQHQQQHQQQRRSDQHHQQSEPEAITSSYFQSGSEEDVEDRESKAGSEGERKVRVRTALNEEQQSFFKEQYAINPRPTRDEFRMIGLRLNLDPRVVQVWFQNNRSRERKMNTYKPPFTSPVLGQTISPAYSPAGAAAAVPTANTSAITSNNRHPSTTNGIEDQPLDLSVKKEIVTPSTSPRYGLAPHQTDSSTPEAINLSRKWSRSPTPFGPLRYYNASTPSHRSGTTTNHDLSSLIRHTPSPNEAVSRHTAANPNPYAPGARGLVPMECLFQMTPEYAEYARSLKLGGLKLGERGTSLSPGSEKRSWRDDESRISHDDEYNFHASKRIKLETSGNSDLDCPFVCDQCDKAFSKQSSLARHKYEHSGQRPYKCEECPKAFKHKHHLTEHKRLHSGEKPFQCTKCLKRFSHSGSYSQHMNHRYSYCKPYRE